MDIAIVGVGGVGGYYGGKLALRYAGKPDTRIIFIARGEHLRTIQKKGIEVHAVSETFTAKPHLATDQPGALGPFDLVLFCVKAYDLEESAAKLQKNVNDQTVIITLLNGVNNAERLGNIFPQAKILNGCVYISAFIEAPGLIRQTGGPCKLFFGTEEGDHATYKSIEKIFTDAGIDAEYREDIRTVVWEKYLFVSPLASATNYLGKKFGEIMEDEMSKSFLGGLVREVELVARAQGIQLPGNVPEVALEKVSSFPHGTKTSLQMDFEKGKMKTELDTFTGYIVQYGEKHGIPVPYHREAYESLSTRV
jgi:2-dehydropantoate 2-reductase